MKKNILTFVLSGFLFSGLVQAKPNDLSATLAISGDVTSDTGSCSVQLDNTSMILGSWDASQLPAQGIFSTAVSANQNVVRLVGDNCKSNSGNTIGVKFTGTPDSAAGNSFINTVEGLDAATGVGVSVYGYEDRTIINPNTSTRLAFDGTLMFYVGMVKLNNETTTPGAVQSSMTVEVDRL